MSNPAPTEPKPAHYWVSEGTGELSSRWVRPLCQQRNAETRRHILDFEGVATIAHAPKCADCEAAVDQAAQRIRS